MINYAIAAVVGLGIASSANAVTLVKVEAASVQYTPVARAKSPAETDITAWAAMLGGFVVTGSGLRRRPAARMVTA